MKTVIIGAKGMLGQELTKVFTKYKPLLWDRNEIDIANQQDVKQKITELKPELIINSAAYNDVDGAEENEELAKQINGYGPGHLSKAADAVGAILVHFSTDYVFKGDNKEGYKESDQPDPQSAYARAKYLGEQMVQSGSSRYYILRLSRLFGRPAASETAKKSFVDMMIELSSTKSELNAVDEELSSPTYAPDLARRTKELVEGDFEFGIYHAANSGACTWYKFVKEIFRIKKINTTVNPVPASFYPRLAVRPDYSILLNTKLTEARSWQDTLKDYLK